MVRTLPNSLSAALNSLTRRPTLVLSVADRVLHYALYQTPGTPESWHDACLASDGSIVRIRLARASSFLNGTFQVQRISDPAQAGQWATSAWVTLPGASGVMNQDGSCAIANCGGLLRAFAQRGSGGNQLWVWTSANNGLSWSGPTPVLSPPGNALIKGVACAGTNDVFFLYDVAGGEALGCSFFNGSGWSSLQSWSLPPLGASGGLAAACTGTLYTLIYSDNYSLSTCTFNAANGQWNLGVAIAPATTTAIMRLAPRLSWADGLYTLSCVEADSGNLTGSVYSYPRLRQSADLVHWSNGTILHMLPCTYGAVVLPVASPASGSAGPRSYVLTMPAIASAPLFQSSNPQQSLDLSPAVLAYRRLERPGHPARLEVLLDNSGGSYNALVSSAGSYRPLGPGATLTLSEGYYAGTPPAPLQIKTGSYVLSQLHFLRSPQENCLLLVASDRTRQLDLLARYQNSYSGQTLAFLISEVCARAGLFNIALPTTNQMSQTIPSFVIQAGQPYRAALDELCNTYGLVYFLDQDEVLRFRELSSSETPAWSYQPEIELLSIGSSDERANHIIVSGRPPASGSPQALTTAETYDDLHLQQVGCERLRFHIDHKLTTTSQCAQKAAFLLAQEQRVASRHRITVPLNPALQLFDAVALSDSLAPTGSGQSLTCRICGLTVHYAAQQSLAEMQLELEGL
ncbi:MAG: hypothetical protein IRZ31_21265 [Thermogemmatispora sp.]|uniref:hypothetical protein n=1 Tax=Thermogemmatispora sp. TaxID=1968838 RepID=UPI00260B5F5E|nr:hypothetical protein [Thermogemmatispora sp.]MBX5459428.1 hypothetical protein [Thermogemmatispora sp.]